jgi:hypothetical protein
MYLFKYYANMFILFIVSSWDIQLTKRPGRSGRGVLLIELWVITSALDALTILLPGQSLGFPL